MCVCVYAYEVKNEIWLNFSFISISYLLASILLSENNIKKSFFKSHLKPFPMNKVWSCYSDTLIIEPVLLYGSQQYACDIV